jgi:hypothetical protein
MTKHIELKRFNQGTALTTGTLALPPFVIEGLEEFQGQLRPAVPTGWDCGNRGNACGRCGTALWQALSTPRRPAGPSLGDGQ